MSIAAVSGGTAIGWIGATAAGVAPHGGARGELGVRPGAEGESGTSGLATGALDTSVQSAVTSLLPPSVFSTPSVQQLVSRVLLSELMWHPQDRAVTTHGVSGEHIHPLVADRCTQSRKREAWLVAPTKCNCGPRGAISSEAGECRARQRADQD